MVCLTCMDDTIIVYSVCLTCMDDTIIVYSDMAREVSHNRWRGVAVLLS